jgi:hypothetical protein
MTRVAEHLAAAVAAILIMTATFVPVVTVPPLEASSAGAPVLA